MTEQKKNLEKLFKNLDDFTKTIEKLSKDIADIITASFDTKTEKKEEKDDTGMAKKRTGN